MTLLSYTKCNQLLIRTTPTSLLSATNEQMAYRDDIQLICTGLVSINNNRNINCTHTTRLSIVLSQDLVHVFQEISLAQCSTQWIQEYIFVYLSCI